MNVMTFDIEDWFHILDHDQTSNPKTWTDYESRIVKNTEYILNSLDNYNQKGTFFCLGWVAKKYPEVIKEIIRRGHEIGSHGYNHELIYGSSITDFREDLQRSLGTIENVIGQKVRYYRAPGFSLTANTDWAFDVLAENGIEIDSSIFPAGRAHGGYKSFGYEIPSVVKRNGISIKEFPINVGSIFSIRIAFSGGGYFRLLPYYLIKYLFAKQSYTISYFHPRDFDPDQPIIDSLSVFRKFKSYVGLNHSRSKYELYLLENDFMSIGEADATIDWNTVPVKQL